MVHRPGGRPGRPRLGVRFEVTAAGLKVARWSYRFEPDPDGKGCTVTEEWTDRRSPPYALVTGLATNVRDRAAHNRDGMERTLAALKVTGEAGA